MKIGVISDTHGFCHPRVFQLFEGAELILHAGDIGDETIITDLEAIAPVTAVFGNIDRPPLTERYPALAEVSIESHLLLVTHQAGPPEHLPEDLKALLQDRRPAALVFGHTHLPLARQQGGVLYLNPGYAGRKRFGWKPSVATLFVTEDGLEATIHSLEDRPQ
ncbi:metallophosphatase family protein [Nitrospinae bacterium AH_259_B05_G02_I21]|nr:metallophosphatase family protein [Nitrospinae bacterium AH_259_B05_G02_I21]